MDVGATASTGNHTVSTAESLLRLYRRNSCYTHIAQHGKTSSWIIFYIFPNLESCLHATQKRRPTNPKVSILKHTLADLPGHAGIPRK